MTATAARTVARTAVPPAPAGTPTRLARVRWSWRLMRRGAALVWLTAALYMGIEVLTFRSAYPDAESRQQLLELSTSTAVRMMQGVPGAIDTAGGFAVWDGGWMLLLIIASWSMLTTARLTRGEEDSGRAELALSRPLTPRQALGAHLSSMGLAAAGLAAAAALPFLVLGEPVAGALLYGAGLALFTLVTAALGALVAQVVEPRRRVVSVGLGLVAGAFLLRVVANSADGRRWLLTATPFGWVDRLRVFAGDSWGWLAAPVAAAAVLGGSALLLVGRRDTGAALLRAHGSHRSSLRMLGSATAFGWRQTAGALAGWAVTLTATALVFGLMTDAIVDFITRDDTYRRMLESMGVDLSEPVIGFLSYIAQFLALPFAAFLGWRIGAARQEEAEGRLDNLLTRGVVRWRWLGVTTAYAVLAATLLAVACSLGLWAGARLVGAPVSAADVAEPMAGTLPVIALFTGLAVLTFGVAPRLTVTVPVTLAVATYLLQTFGAMLHWPDAVLGMSPFHHLAALPGDPMTAGSIAVMCGLGVAFAAAGVVAFSRRDLRGA